MAMYNPLRAARICALIALGSAASACTTTRLPDHYEGKAVNECAPLGVAAGLRTSAQDVSADVAKDAATSKFYVAYDVPPRLRGVLVPRLLEVCEHADSRFEATVGVDTTHLEGLRARARPKLDQTDGPSSLLGAATASARCRRWNAVAEYVASQGVNASQLECPEVATIGRGVGARQPKTIGIETATLDPRYAESLARASNAVGLAPRLQPAFERGVPGSPDLWLICRETVERLSGAALAFVKTRLSCTATDGSAALATAAWEAKGGGPSEDQARTAARSEIAQELEAELFLALGGPEHDR